MCDFFAHSLARTKAFHVAKKDNCLDFLSFVVRTTHCTPYCIKLSPVSWTFCQLPFKVHGDVNVLYNATLTGSNRDILSLLKGEPPTQSASGEPPCSTMELTVLEIMDLARVR